MSEEEEAIDTLLKMSLPELDLVPFDTVKLICQAKGCKRHTKVRNYGLSPVYYVPRFKPKERWHNIDTNFFLCHKHCKLYYRLLKNYDYQHIFDKIINFEKLPIEKL